MAHVVRPILQRRLVALPSRALQRSLRQPASTLLRAVLEDYKGHSYPHAVEIDLRWRDLDAFNHVNNAREFATDTSQPRPAPVIVTESRPSFSQNTLPSSSRLAAPTSQHVALH